MGGGYALDVALAEPHLAATVINYGHLATDPAELKKINAPILGLFGGQDRGITPEDVKKFQQAMEKLGKKIEVKIYPDAGHAFENPNNKQGYRAEDAADAWRRTVDFLAELKKLDGPKFHRSTGYAWNFHLPEGTALVTMHASHLDLGLSLRRARRVL